MRLRILCLCIVSVVIFSGCLTFTSRTYTYTLNDDGSVDLVIQYNDIRSTPSLNEGEEDTGFVENDEPEYISEVKRDYETLITQYFVSDYFASCYPRGKVTRRKLYEENGMLNAEVKVHFNNLAEAGFYRDGRKNCLRSDSLCGFLAVLDSVSIPAVAEFRNDTSSGYYNPYYIFKWKKKEKLMLVKTVSYFPNPLATSLLDEWKKDK